MNDLGLSVGERLLDDEECLRRAIENKLDNLRVAMPGEIVDFDKDTQTATVKPLIKEYCRGRWESLPLLLDVPCFFPRAGGYALTFPVKVGDECLVIFNDMCIDAWWQSGGEQTQLETRRHDLSDAMCLLGITSVPKAVKEYSTDSLMFRNEDKDVYFEITDGKIMNICGIDNINVATQNILNIIAANNINIGTQSKLNIFGATEIDIETSEKLNVKVNTINLNFDGKTAVTQFTTENIDTGNTTISISLDGENGKISMKTFDKDTGEETGSFDLP